MQAEYEDTTLRDRGKRYEPSVEIFRYHDFEERIEWIG